MGWTRRTTSDGRLYYYNERAGISQWGVPELPSGWDARISSTGQVYYINQQAGTTQWRWPSEAVELSLLPGQTESPRHVHVDPHAQQQGAVDAVDAQVLLALE